MMPETVRIVSDGEEMLLSEGEAFRVHTTTAPDVAARRAATPAAPERIAIRYLGFQDVQGRREFMLNAQRGDQVRRHAVWIELAAFSRRQALLQDGPDICYQKLMRELTGSEGPVPDDIEVTEGDLAAYRETHAAPVRRGFSPPRPQEPKPAEKPAPVDAGPIA